MNYIGIDPSADTFTYTIFKDGQRMQKAHTLASTAEGITELLAAITNADCTRHDTLICVENTGVFSEMLLYELHKASWPLALLEPKKVHDAFGKERPKSDELDSAYIAEYGWRFRDKLSLWQPNEAIVEQIHVLLTTREQLVGQKTALFNTRKNLLRKYIQTPVANNSVDTLIEQITRQIKELELDIKRLIHDHPTFIQTVALVMSAPGVGWLLAAHLLVITRGFSEQPTYRQLARYLGIAPMPHQSGTSVKKPDRSRGNGPRMMRKLLHLAARSMITHSSEFKAYYARKLAQGKPKKLVLNNVSNRLLRIVCSMLKNNKPYIKGYVSVNPRLLST